jgi:hypothetical protein
MAELAVQIANATFKFSQDVKNSYESELIPKRRLGDKNFDKIDQAKLALGAFSFFMHVLDRYLLDMGSFVVRDRVFDFIIEELVQKVYVKSFTGPPAQVEKFVLNHYDSKPIFRIAQHLWPGFRGHKHRVVARGPDDLSGGSRS